MSLENYSIAIKLKLFDGVSSVLFGLRNKFGDFNRDVMASQKHLGEVENHLKAIRGLTAGGLMVGAGLGVVSMFKPALDEAKKFQTEVTAFKALNYGDAINEQAVSFAKSMDVMGASARDNVRLIREATTIMGDFGHAKEAVPMLARTRFGIQAVMDADKAEDFDTQFQAILKTSELRGALVNRTTGKVDVKQLSRVNDMMVQAYVASGGLVKPTDYLAAIKTGGVSTKMMSDEMFFYGLGHFMQESGGSRTGTASMSAFQNMVMGRMPQQIAEQWAKHGLLDKSHIHYGKTGHITKVDPMGAVDAEEAATNPFHYINSVIVPQLKKEGLSGNKLNLTLASLFGIRTASNLADQFVREEKIADNYIARAKKAAGADQLYQLGAQTMQGKELDLEAKWASLMNELGTSVLPVAIKALEGLTDAIKSLTGAAGAHPTITKGVEYGALGLAGLSIAGGAGRAAMWGLRLLPMIAGGAAVALATPEVLLALGIGATAYGGYKAYQSLRDQYSTKKPTVNVTVQNKVDKDGLTTMVTHGQTKAASRPQTGISGVDWRQVGMIPGGL